MARLSAKPLGALGALGQNTQTSDIDLPPGFAALAVNGFIDQSGRFTARKSAERGTSDNADLTTTAGVKRVFRHNKADGTSVFFCSGNNRIFSSDGSTLTSRSSGHTADLWQFATLNGKCFAAQASHSLRWFNETTFAETTLATPSNPRAIFAAFGRLWALSSDGWTLYWSVLLDGTDFAGAGSGSLDLSKTHKNLRTPGMAVAAFGRQIVVICRNAVILLGLANNLDPGDATTPIYLADQIDNIGTIARDSVVSTGDDLLFLADDGVRSLARSLVEREGPAPLTDVSALNTDALLTAVAGETSADAIAACYHPEESWYQLFLPSTYEVWTFDMTSKVPQTNVPRTTVWRMGSSRVIYHGVYWTDDVLYYGCKGGLATAAAYDATDSYDYIIETGWLSLETPDALKHFKKLLLNLRGGSGQTGTIKWYVDFDDTTYRSATFTLSTSQTAAEWGVDEYNEAEYSAGLASADIYTHLSNSAKFIKFVITIPVTGYPVTLNNAQIFFNQGRVR